MRMVRVTSLLAWSSVKEYRNLAPSDFVEWEINDAAVKAEIARMDRQEASELWEYVRANKFPVIDSSRMGSTRKAEAFTPPNSTTKPWPLIYVSHRWITPDSPDPDGTQLRELQSRLRKLIQQDPELEKWLIFLDYCALPQKPRNAEEEAVFQHGLGILKTLLVCAGRVIILSEGYSDYKNRSWCFFEAVIGKQKLYLFPDQDTILNDLTFLQWLPVNLYNGERRIVQIYSHDLSYKPNMREVEAIVAIFQHLSACKASDASDRPAIKREMISFLAGRKMSPLVRLLTSLSRYCEIAFAALDRLTYNAYPCRPYFEEPTWIRLPALEPSMQFDPPPRCVFSIPGDILRSAQKHRTCPETGTTLIW